MSIFDRFNDQGMGNREAFEELCCQLFETWGLAQEAIDDSWTYRDIRGEGGDGGIEAYWRNPDSSDCIGIQAKWFPDKIDGPRLSNIRESLDTAMGKRPMMSRYIVCVPRNLTSKMGVTGGRSSKGEDERWDDLKAKATSEYPGLHLDLWDEEKLSSLLQAPANEGRRRFWFDRSLVNPVIFKASLDKALADIKDRYVPELAGAGGLSDFLDGFYGTRSSREALLQAIDSCLAVYDEITGGVRSLLAMGGHLPDGLGDDARSCMGAIEESHNGLRRLRDLVTSEPWNSVRIGRTDTDYSAIVRLEDTLGGCRSQPGLATHSQEITDALERLRELPTAWEIEDDVERAFGSSHCIVLGNQGTGKTCGLAMKAQEFLAEREHIPLLIRAADVAPEGSWRDVIAARLGLGGDWDEATLLQALSSSAALWDRRGGDLHIRAKVAVMVDGLDERPPSALWARMMRQADAISHDYPRIRFCYSSRPAGVDFGKEGGGLLSCRHVLDPTGDVPVSELFDRYVAYYRIHLDGQTYKWMLRTPMELRLFCTAYEGRTLKRSERVSITLTGLIEAEIGRLEEEFSARARTRIPRHAQSARRSLDALATTLLRTEKPLAYEDLMGALTDAGVDGTLRDEMVELFEDYGILCTRETPAERPLAAPETLYSPGSRHLWDYFMAIRLIDEDHVPAPIVSSHPDMAEMYAILLVEKDGMLPQECPDLAQAVGERRAHMLSLYALANAAPDTTARFAGWALGEMRQGGDHLGDVVNGVVARVADSQGHPLGPSLLDEFLRSFASPIARDAVWSMPTNFDPDYRFATQDLREQVRHMPSLHAEEAHDQMPLLFAWLLSTVNGPKRSCCRGELTKWGIGNPTEFATIFERFATCDDPQVREDMFAMAEEVVCQGTIPREAEAAIARSAVAAVFAEPDGPGNRDAAIRYYGRILVERCRADGLVDDEAVLSCRPPYRVEPAANPLPIFPDACGATRMEGFGPIDYDLARYVLVDELEHAFNIPLYGTRAKRQGRCLDGVIAQSAADVGVEPPRFEAWAIAAAYQYLLDHGYDPDVFEGPIMESGYRAGGLDRRITGSFHPADHGERSTVMTVAEKYVWCARNEICGYLADRMPVAETSWAGSDSCHRDSCSLVKDYGLLLDFDSPLLEATARERQASCANVVPTFSSPFSCSDGSDPCSEDELRTWAEATPAEAAEALLGWEPTEGLLMEGPTIPLKLYACDWAPNGRSSRAWIYSGSVDAGELARLEGASSVCLDGCRSASDLEAGVASSTGVSPVELLASPWMEETSSRLPFEGAGDVHLHASPLSLGCVTSLTDVGDYWWSGPTRWLREACGVIRTDGTRYYDESGATVFGDARCGIPYRCECQGLFADRERLMRALGSAGKALVWYASISRDANALAKERLPRFAGRTERSWLLWMDDGDGYRSLPIPDESD